MSRKSNWKVLCVVFGLIVSVGMLTVGGGHGDETIHLVFWHHEAPAHRVAAFQQVIDLFEAEHPNIRVTQEVVMWGETWARTIAAIMAGEGPDFRFGIPDLVLTAYLLDGILPVTDLVRELDERYDFFDRQIEIYYHDGEYWGIPIFTMIYLLTYRPSLLYRYGGVTEPPIDWEEYLALARRITENSPPYIFGSGLSGAINLMVSQQAFTFMANVGAKFFDEEGNVIFNSPETIRAMEMYRDLFQYSPPGALAWAWGEVEMNVMAGTIAMATYFPSVQSRFHYELDCDDYRAAHHPFPHPLKGGRPGSITYPNEIQIFQWTADRPGHLEATKTFIRFIMRPEINWILTAGMEPGAFFPVTYAAAAASEFWNHPIIARFYDMNRVAIEALEYATLFGFEHGRWVNLGIGDITGANILAEVVHRIVTGVMTVEEAVAWGHEEMELFSVPVGSGD